MTATRRPEQKQAPQKTRSLKRWLKISFAIFLILLIGIISFGTFFEMNYFDAFYPGTRINGFNLTGMTRESVVENFKNIEDTFRTQGITIKAEGKSIAILPVSVASDPDLARTIYSFQWRPVLDEAYAYGRTGHWCKRLGEQFSLLIGVKRFEILHAFNREEFLNTLRMNFGDLEKPPIDAKLVLDGENAEISGEQSGYVFDYHAAADQFERQLGSLDQAPIMLKLVLVEPRVLKQNAQDSLRNLNTVLSIKELTVTAESKQWTIDQATLRSWLEFQNRDGKTVIGVNREMVSAFLAEIAKEIDVPAADAKFRLENGRVAEFQASRDGKAVDMAANYDLINNQIIAGGIEPIGLIVAVTESKVATGDVNDLGIRELIGRGTSNFAGSPVNRRHNIAVGAKSLDGILIAPDEEFSLLKALGPIDGEHGYKTELVIKGNRTVPEYGGGLCQIGTTTFRAALYSGLPIVERRNHSYRVIYYEPAGMDATIYDPAPDMKFKNDTGHYILFTTHIDGDNLIFEFYGTKDGRAVIIDPEKPTIYNVTSPGPVRYIETDELEPGQKKKVESAHAGADTYFKYTVTYQNGEVNEQEFYSHYVPWAEVWMIGRTPSSTDATIPAPENP